MCEIPSWYVKWITLKGPQRIFGTTAILSMSVRMSVRESIYRLRYSLEFITASEKENVCDVFSSGHSGRHRLRINESPLLTFSNGVRLPNISRTKCYLPIITSAWPMQGHDRNMCENLGLNFLNMLKDVFAQVNTIPIKCYLTRWQSAKFSVSENRPS